MKKIIFLILVFISVIMIYFLFKDNKIYYFSIIDYDSKYSFNNYLDDYFDEKGIKEKYVNYKANRVIDLINSINDNDYIGDKKIKNILIKADLVTISIGRGDLVKYDYDYLNNYLGELDELIGLLRKNCKEKIIFIGYYNTFNDPKYNQYISYLNNNVKEICNKYNVNYIDVEDMIMNLDNNIPIIEQERIVFNRIRCLIDK